MSYIKVQLNTLCPDFYIRYLYVFQIIKSVNKNKPCTILDIGGKCGILGDFIKKEKLPYKLTVLDILPDNINNPTTCDIFLQKDFNKENISQYDFIVSLDALEHIDNKEKFINTALKKCSTLIITAPFESKIVKEVEKNANQFYKNYTKTDHPWLKEHLQNKLPNANWLEKLIKQKKYHLNKIESNNVENWLLFMTTNFLPSFYDLKDNKELIEINKFYNQNFFNLGDSQFPTYRSIYTISKNKKNITKIKTLIKPIDIKLKTQFISLITNFFTKEIYSLNNKLIKEKKDLDKQENKIKIIYQKINKEIFNFQSKNHDLINQIENIKQIISKDEFQLNQVLSSKYFKIWQIYCNVKKIIKK